MAQSQHCVPSGATLFCKMLNALLNLVIALCTQASVEQTQTAGFDELVFI